MRGLFQEVIQGSITWNQSIDRDRYIVHYFDILNNEEFLAVCEKIMEGTTRGPERSNSLAFAWGDRFLYLDGEIQVEVAKMYVDEILAGVPVVIRSRLRVRPSRDEMQKNTRDLEQLQMDEISYFGKLEGIISDMFYVALSLDNFYRYAKRRNLEEIAKEYQPRVVNFCASALNTMLMHFREFLLENLSPIEKTNIQEKYYKKHEKFLRVVRDVSLSFGNSERVSRPDRAIFINQCKKVQDMGPQTIESQQNWKPVYDEFSVTPERKRRRA